ncbi:Abi family protein (plasmid) [Glutamicibacter bergerei]|uniref:Abi family protein n=1 Tax=Glutamicibacter ardleyensis TaxID=225894 RepID=UPI003FD5269C
MAKRSGGHPPWISKGRFQKYMDAANGDAKLALELYSWNADLGAALFKDFSHFEIALRNSCDKALFRRGQSLNPKADWLKSKDASLLVLPNSPGTQKTVRKLSESLEDAREYSGFFKDSSLPRGKILAELSFGFWKYLFTHEMRQTLWEECLEIEFRYVDRTKTVDPTKLHADLEKLAKLRNRIAHHESIFDKSPQADHDALLRVIELLGAEANTFVRSHSTVRAIIASRPTR